MFGKVFSSKNTYIYINFTGCSLNVHFTYMNAMVTITNYKCITVIGYYLHTWFESFNSHWKSSFQIPDHTSPKLPDPSFLSNLRQEQLISHLFRRQVKEQDQLKRRICYCVYTICIYIHTYVCAYVCRGGSGFRKE